MHVNSGAAPSSHDAHESAVQPADLVVTGLVGGPVDRVEGHGSVAKDLHVVRLAGGLEPPHGHAMAIEYRGVLGGQLHGEQVGTAAAQALEAVGGEVRRQATHVETVHPPSPSPAHGHGEGLACLEGAVDGEGAGPIATSVHLRRPLSGAGQFDLGALSVAADHVFVLGPGKARREHGGPGGHGEPGTLRGGRCRAGGQRSEQSGHEGKPPKGQPARICGHARVDSKRRDGKLLMSAHTTSLPHPGARCSARVRSEPTP